MTTDLRARWTATGALTLAGLALGLSTWAVGCRGESATSERQLAPSVPAVAAAARTTTADAPAKTNEPAVTPASVTPKPAPTARPSSAPGSPTAAKDALEIRRVVVTHAIENREPAIASELSIGDAPILAFVELANSGEEEQRVIVTFERGGSSVGHVKLRVPGESRRWRTWGQTRRIQEPGEWQAVVRTEDGHELSRTAFVVK
jgi:hypothetical protein